jgi:hypothetical protein
MVQAEQGRGETGGLEVRLRFDFARLMGTAFLPLALLLWILDPFDGNVTVVSGVLGGAVLLLSVVFWTQQLRLRSLGCLLRIDAAGVTVGAQPTVPWGDLRKVEVVRRRLVTFVPKSERVTLPVMPSGTRRRDPRRTRERLLAQFGTPLVVATSAYNVGVEEIVGAVRAYSGGLPVFD